MVVTHGKFVIKGLGHSWCHKRPFLIKHGLYFREILGNFWASSIHLKAAVFLREMVMGLGSALEHHYKGGMV